MKNVRILQHAAPKYRSPSHPLSLWAKGAPVSRICMAALLVFIVAVAGSGIPVLVAVLGIAYWEQYARLIRAQTLSLRESLFAAPSVFIVAVALMILLLGDWLREVLDVKTS